MRQGTTNMRQIEKISDLFKRRGYRVSSVEKESECFRLIIEVDGVPYILMFYPSKYSSAIVAKVMLRYASCYESLYDPNGLFIVTDSAEEFIDRFFNKIHFLRVIKRI